MSRSNGIHENETPPLRERAALVRLALPGESPDEVDESLAEMKRLADTAGANVVAEFVQRRETPCAATLVGSGKVEIIAAACAELNIDVVLVDSDLSPRQGAKLEKLLDCKVVDRTQLILDIFAQHAQTNEGKHQVELAQLQYALPRLTGRGSVMRQQGGIGVRGPGEQKLEVDRRVIRDRIHRLKRDLDTIRKNRRVQSKRRDSGATGAVSLVGYTNAGKSSLLNALSGAEVYVADQLFATLDPRSRRVKLPSHRYTVFTDTVGFIRKLPHSLVAAFSATLEVVAEAEILLLVADASDPAVEDQIRAVHEVLDEIKVSGPLVVNVYNKIDVAEPEVVTRLLERTPRSVAVSAHTGEGLDALMALVDELLADRRCRLVFRIPQGEAGIVTQVHAAGRVISQEYEGNDILLDAEVDEATGNRLAHYAS